MQSSQNIPEHEVTPPITSNEHVGPPGVVPTHPHSLNTLIDASVATFLFNPIMGHVQATFTSPFLRRNILISTRYDINCYSFDADVAVGLQYHPSHRQSMAMRMSWRHGLALSLNTGISDTVSLKLGISSGPIWSKPSGVESNPLPPPTTILTPSIGLQLCIES